MPKKKVLKYIAVDGPIGAGKTTLTKILAEDMGGTPLFEPIAANPFLSEFYKNRKQNAFKTQLFFLLNRYQQQLELKKDDRYPPPVICDYTFAKDVIFARLNLSSDELALYDTIYQMLAKELPRPDLVIYLRAESPVMLKRIKKRGFDYERPITEDYLESLTEAYNQYFLDYNETPLLVVDSSAVNYEQNLDDFANLKREVVNHRGGTVHFIARSA